MKKTLVFLSFLLAISFASKAQNPNKMWIGGSISFASIDNSRSDATTALGIYPEFGYKLNDRFALGIEGGYSHGKTDSYKADGYRIAPFARYYMTQSDFVNFFVDALVSDTHSTSENSYWEYDNNMQYLVTTQYKANLLEIGLRPGISLDLSQRVALTAKYGFIGYARETESETNMFKMNVDLSNILLGANFRF